jgi:hypothetical protein
MYLCHKFDYQIVYVYEKETIFPNDDHSYDGIWFCRLSGK